MKTLLYFLLFIICTTGCSSPEKNAEVKWIERKMPDTKTIPAYDSININQTFDLITWNIHNNRACFVGYGVTDNFISLYEYPGNKKLFECGRIGQGPDEFITLNQGQATENNILLYDIMGRKVLIYTILNNNIQIIKRLPLYNDSEGMCKPFTFITQIDNNNFLMKIDDVNTSSFEITNLQEKEVINTFTNTFRKPNSSYTPFDFTLCVNDTILINAYKYTDRIVYYSIKEQKLQPLFAMGSKEDQSELKDYNYLKYYYLDVVSKSNYFYCLKSISGTEIGNIIEVYSKTGEIVACYKLNKEVSSIRFDNEGYLAGYVPDINQTIIYRFLLT